MSTTVEELVTIYRMHAGPYVDGAHKVIDSTKEAGEIISKLTEKILVLAGIGGLVELAKKSLEVAGTFDVIERKLAGLTGSFERAKEIMAFGEEEGMRFGLFSPEKLDAAAMKLEAFGLQAERYLPVVEKLGAIFGESGEGLDVFAEAIGRISQGNPGRAMMILAKAGIGQKALEQHGVQFKGHQVTSDSATVINAIEAAVTEKYGGVLKELEGSPEAKFARLSVAWEIAMRKMGGGLQQVLLPLVESLSKALTKMTEGGQLDRIVKGFSDLFHLDGADGLVNAFTAVGDVMEGLPAKIQSFQSAFMTALNTIIPLLTVAASIWAGVMLAGPIVEFATVVIAAWSAIAATISIADAAAFVFDALTANIPGIVAALGVAALTYVALSTAIGAAYDAIGNYQAGLPVPGHEGGKHAPAAPGKPAAPHPPLDPNAKHLEEIAAHTARMADLQQRQLDIQRMLAGGGDIMAHTLSNADLAGLGSQGARARVTKVAVALMDVVSAEVTEALKRQGRVRTA